MSDLYKDIASLSPEQRKLLELLLEREGGDPGQLAGLPSGRAPDNLPLSFVQERIWFLEELFPGNFTYNASKGVRLEGPLDVPALEKSLGEIVRRHEIFRVTCSTVAGRPIQKLEPFQPFRLREVDLRELPDWGREAEANCVLIEDAQTPLDLGRAPLMRATLIKLDDDMHYLSLVTHHYVVDGWSFELILRELVSLYRAYINRETSPLSELSIQYADAAYWQREQIQGQLFDEQLDYWRKQLAGSPALLDLPTDKPRPALRNYKGGKLWFEFPPPLADAIKAFSRKERVTVFMTLLAAFQALLHRYTGQVDILVGTSVSNRKRVEMEELIGSFANNLVLRTDFSADPTFRELLSQVRGVVVNAFAHQDMPFEVLVQELGPERSLSRNPLFQAMLILHEETMFYERQSDELRWNLVTGCAGKARFDLMLETAGWQYDQPLAYFEYSTELFEDATIVNMRDHYLTLLQAVMGDPDGRISELPLLTEAERRQLLVDWNDTHRDGFGLLCVQQLFERQAASCPDSVAAAFEGDELTYRKLNQRANQMAHYLREQGVGNGDLVGIYLKPSLEMVVALLGVLKAGGAYVPLDPDFPRERLAFMVRDAGLSALLTQEDLLESIPDHQVRATCLDSDWDRIAVMPPGELASGVEPDDLAYLIFTSGSTGEPKGVKVPHRAVVNFLQSMAQEPGLGDRDTLLAVTTLSFDIAGLEIFLPLSVGARLELASREVASDGRLLARKLHQAGVTVMQATPATWRMLVDTGWQGDAQLKMLCGGEALPSDLSDQLLKRGAALWNMYGPTETTIWSLIDRVEPGAPVTIGRPIANTQVYILDPVGQPVPVGVPGELHIGGLGLAQGYHNQPELMREKFISNPFSGDPDARLYKTGDLARYFPDGKIEFLGRNDLQVKIRGFRIELGEVEAALNWHPAVREAVVVVRADDAGDKVLVAYLVLDQYPAPSVGQMRRFLSDKLPDYMVPAAFVVLEAFPLTPNGKVDRRALPPPDGARPNLESEYVPPQTPTEKRLVEIWGELLGAERLGIHDNFFELGGHSLLAVQLISCLQDTFQVEAPLRLVFESATVSEQALAIEDLLLSQVEDLSEEEAQRML